ncbi:hypothetical protein MGAST_18350 [Mycobacterium gastri 'Wayne']|nr:hypothetical protein MGAST_18350 [Mycobacterium gastri 'Wayne']
MRVIDRLNVVEVIHGMAVMCQQPTMVAVGDIAAPNWSAVSRGVSAQGAVARWHR